MPLDTYPRPQTATTTRADRKRANPLAQLRAQTLLRRLEPRIMFDAAAVATAVDAHHHDAAHPAGAAHAEFSAADIATLAAHIHGPVVIQADPAAKSVVFIDAHVQDPAAIEKAAGANAEIVLLDANEDGLTQIAQFLAGHSGLESIHIVSHGAQGELFLGSGAYTSTNLKAFDTELSQIGSSLQPGGDILLYGCDVAQGAAGDAFVHKFADLTHANIAASTDETGSAAGGGNWVLEDQVGAVHTAAIHAQAWNGELTAVANNGKGALLTVTGSNIYSVDITSGKATLVTTVPASVGGVAFSGVANSLAVDQADGLIYYCDNAVSSSNVALFAYDFVNDQHILISSNVTTFGIAPGSVGLGASGATFGNGKLYLGVDNPSGTEDAIYAVTLTNSGRTIASATHLNTNLPLTNDWGDLGFDPINNNLLSFSAPDLSVTRIDLTTGATIGTALPMPSTAGYQGSQDVAGDVFAVGATIQQINPLTGAAIGPNITVTTDGTTAVGGANDAAGWTPPTATIQGHVYWDNNSNKTIDAGDAPMANVTVQLYTDINNDGIINGKDALLATDTTDASGQYQFTGALPGDYIVKVSDANGVIGTHSYSTTGGAINSGAHIGIIGSTVSDIDFGVANSVTAANDTFTTFSTTPITIAATANDSDAQHDAFSITGVNGTAFSAQTTSIAVTGGSVSLDANDNLVFTPNTGYTGSPSFTYTVTDAHGASATATVSGTVSFAPPVAGNDTFSTNANSPVSVPVLGNDTDVNGFPLTITEVGTTAITAGGAAVSVTDGTVKLDASGDLIFTPTANFTGAVPAFTYTESDGHGNVATATVTGSVVDVPPSASNDTFATAQGTAAAILALTNDSSPVGLPLTITSINSTAIIAGGAAVAIDHGTVALNATGVLTYTPTAGYNGPEAFTYTISDGHGGTATANVTGTIYAPPALAADTFATPQGVPVTISVLANDSDVNGFPLTITKIGSTAITAGGAAVAVTDGTVKLNIDGTLTFTPASTYTGAVPAFTYTVSDGNGGTATANVSGTVYAPPVANPNTFAVTTGLPITLDVLGNDSDPNNFALTITSINGSPIAAEGAGVAVTGGTVTMDAAGNLTYAPDPSYNGSPTFAYTIDDGHGGTATTTVSGVVSPLNHPPVNIVPGTQEVAGGSIVLSSANGNALQVTDDASATAIIQTTVSVDTGTLTLAQTTGLTFLTGTGTNNATITIQGTKSAINAALDGMTYKSPGALATGPANLTITTNDLGQPSGEDIPNGSFETTLVSVPAGHQTITNQSNVPGWTTTATDHMIEIWGSGFLGVPAYEGIHFAELNANQVAADVNSTQIPEGQPLDFSFAHRGRQGTDVMNVTVVDAGADGVFGTADDTVLMNKNFSDGNTAWGVYDQSLGTSSGNPIKLIFTSVSSAGGSQSVGNFLDAVHLGTTHLTDTDTVSLLPAPVATADNFTTAAGTPVTYNPLANDSDANGFALSISQINGAAITSGTPVALPDGSGSITVNADNTITFAPAAGYAGKPSFTYTVSDGHGGTATATDTGTVYAPPVANPDNFGTAEGSATVIHPLANDTDPNAGFTLHIADINGTTVTVGSPVNVNDSVTGNPAGTITVDASGNITFAPAAGYAGTPSLTYTIDDGHGGEATASVNGTVWAPPVAVDDTFHTSSGIPATIPALINDTDPNAGFVLSISQINGTPIIAGGAAVTIDHGTVKFNTDGTVTFTPTAGYSGPEAFTYTIDDGHGGKDTATVSGTTYPPPVANNDGFATAAGAPDTIPVLANDSDPKGFAFGITAVDGSVITKGGPAVTVQGGTVTENSNGDLIFTPNAGYTGTPSFTYTITDDHGGQATATVSGAVYAPPTPVNDTFGVAENGSTPIAALSNDTDANGFALTVTQVNGQALSLGGPAIATAHGSVAMTASGILTYSPNAGYSGTDSFSYAVDDGHGGTATAQVDGTVYAPPMATNDTFSANVGSNATINVLSNDTDLSGLPLSVVTVNGSPVSTTGAPVTVTGGVVSLDPFGNLSFKPNAGFEGPTSFVYAITDGHGGSASATVNGNIWGPSLPKNDSFGTAEGAAAIIHPLVNDTDPNGLPLTVVAINGAAIDAAHPVTVTGGVVSLNPDGTLTYSPNAGYTGSPSFTYTEANTHGYTAQATVNGTVWAPPAASNDSFAIAAGTPVAVPTLANDTDPNGFALTVTQVNGTPLDATHPVAVTGGSVSLNPDGTLTYTPNAGYAGTPSFSYTANDGHGGTATATVNGTVWAPPAASNDSFAIAAGTPVVVSTLANDTDPNGFALTVTQVNGTPLDATHPVAVTGGSVSLNPDGTLTYTPNAGYAGTPSFSYTANDGHGGTATATVNGTVWAPPNASPDSFATIAGNPVLLHPLANDSDPNGFNLTVNAIDGHHIAADGAPVVVEGGSISLHGDGELVFTPAPGYNGTPSFTYTISDGHGGVAVGTISGKVAASLNLSQHEQGRSHDTENGENAVKPTLPESTDEFIHPVAGTEKAEFGSTAGEHIRLVVEGATHKLDQEYGAGAADVPLRTMLGAGREPSSGNSNLYEPLGGAPFWHDLTPLDFSKVTGHAADLDGFSTKAMVADEAGRSQWLEPSAAPFSERIAHVKARFDREALQLGVDFAHVA